MVYWPAPFLGIGRRRAFLNGKSMAVRRKPFNSQGNCPPGRDGALA
jgi:hypothetical protein